MTQTQKYRIQVKIQEKRISTSLIHRIWVRKFYKQWYVKEDSHKGTYRTNMGSEHYGCLEKHSTSEREVNEKPRNLIETRKILNK
jgi:hypothetical protein